MFGDTQDVHAVLPRVLGLVVATRPTATALVLAGPATASSTPWVLVEDVYMRVREVWRRGRRGRDFGGTPIRWQLHQQRTEI